MSLLSPSCCCCPQHCWDRDWRDGGFWLGGCQRGVEAGGLILPLWGGSDGRMGVLCHGCWKTQTPFWPFGTPWVPGWTLVPTLGALAPCGVVGAELWVPMVLPPWAGLVAAVAAEPSSRVPLGIRSGGHRGTHLPQRDASLWCHLVSPVCPTLAGDL